MLKLIQLFNGHPRGERVCDIVPQYLMIDDPIIFYHLVQEFNPSPNEAQLTSP